MDDFLVFELSSTGTPEWARTFGGTNMDAAYSINPDKRWRLCSGSAVNSTSSPGANLVACNPSASNPNPTITTPDPRVSDVCPPSAIDESERDQSWPRIVCVTVAGGVVFDAPGDMDIRIYAADGRLFISTICPRAKPASPLTQAFISGRRGM
ncbi:MAG: hypothetical protein ACPL68_03775 [Candidatus Hydrothermia bacterium]